MLKPIAIGVLCVSAAVTGAAFAGNQGGSNSQPGTSLLCELLPFLCPPPKNNGGGGGGAMAAPEIDPASAMGGLTLLGAALAVVRGRRAVRKQA